MPEEKFTSYKNLSCLFIAILLVIGGYYALNLFGNVKSGGNGEVSKNAFFTPPTTESNKINLIGSIQKDNTSLASKSEYILVDSDGKTLGYLTSSNIDFTFSVGLNVEINGKPTTQKKNGYAIIEVESMKLK